jgi:putative drug exporter of the RND superfamily
MPTDGEISGMVRNDSATRPGKNGNGDGVFAWLGRVAVRHPWRVIALWIVAAVAVIATSPGLPTTTNESSFLPSSYESIRASALQDRAFPQASSVSGNAAIIVFAKAGGARLTAADSAKVRQVVQALNNKHRRG